MPRDKALSHNRIVRAAMDEFYEYGYDKASMRRIGKRCGLTAAALYRHFDSKEAMFDAIVGPAVEDMKEWIERHVASSEAFIETAFIEENSSDPAGAQAGDLWSSTEIDMMRELIYPHMSEYSMIINKSRGSKYEGFLSELADEHQRVMSRCLDKLRKQGFAVRDISNEELHILITAYCTALFEPVVHNYSLEDAVRYLDTVEAFFMPGWKKLLGFA